MLFKPYDFASRLFTRHRGYSQVSSRNSSKLSLTLSKEEIDDCSILTENSLYMEWFYCEHCKVAYGSAKTYRRHVSVCDIKCSSPTSSVSSL